MFCIPLFDALARPGQKHDVALQLQSLLGALQKPKKAQAVEVRIHCGTLRCVHEIVSRGALAGGPAQASDREGSLAVFPAGKAAFCFLVASAQCTMVRAMQEVWPPSKATRELATKLKEAKEREPSQQQPFVVVELKKRAVPFSLLGSWREGLLLPC